MNEQMAADPVWLQTGKERYSLIDALRGLTIISMILYHGAYDYIYMFDGSISWYGDTAGYLWQQSICWSFIFLSGISWSFGKNPLKRGVIVFGWGIGVSLVTLLIMPDFPIIFGVLSLIGSGMLLMIPLEKRFNKISSVFGLTGSLGLFFLFRNVNEGWLGFEGINLIPLPDFLYEIPGFFVLGFPSESFYSTDYFSLLPWLFLYFSGYFFWNMIKERGWIENRMLKDLLMMRIPILSGMGRKSLLIYLIHQPLLMGFFYMKIQG